MKKVSLAALAFASLGILSAEAKVSLASPFTDNMVLQREREVAVWGKADAGETVSVSFYGQCVNTVADKDGKWRVKLAPMQASKTNRSLYASGKENAIEVKNVLVGEVWIASGQSNMECPLWGANPRFRDGQGAMVAQYTDIPHFRVANCSKYQWDVSPRDSMQIVWSPMNPQTALKSVSAVAFYYGLELVRTLDIPVGILDSRWGGTNIDAWTPREGIASIPELKDVLDYPVKKDWNKDTDRKGPIGGPQQQPTVLYNANIAPYAPYTVRGMIWYQGCHNAGEHQRYAAKMHALYNGFAKVFENPDFKLYFVQLTPWGSPVIPYIQEAQQKFANEEKNARMAVINDIGNLTDIHPNNKETVGKRLALHALKNDYGFKNIVADSPTLKEYKIENGKFILSFNNATSFYVYNQDRFSLATGFEIAGADGKFVPAKIENIEKNGNVKGAQIIVSADGVTEPKKLRYLYSKPWFGALYSQVALPVGVFHIDAN